jgi:hypothetical protein
LIALGGGLKNAGATPYLGLNNRVLDVTLGARRHFAFTMPFGFLISYIDIKGLRR